MSILKTSKIKKSNPFFPDIYGIYRKNSNYYFVYSHKLKLKINEILEN